VKPPEQQSNPSGLLDAATSPPDPQAAVLESTEKMVQGLRRRLRRGKLMSFKDWMKSVSDLLDHLD